MPSFVGSPTQVQGRARYVVISISSSEVLYNSDSGKILWIGLIDTSPVIKHVGAECVAATGCPVLMCCGNCENSPTMSLNPWIKFWKFPKL